MFIRFKIKSLYVITLALGISFLWTMIVFGVFSSTLSEETLAAILIPMWLFIFGLSLLLVDLWWHWSDPNAEMFFALFSTKTWSILLMLLSIYISVTAIQTTGFDMNITKVLLFTLGSGAVLVALYVLVKKRKTNKLKTK